MMRNLQTLLCILLVIGGLAKALLFFSPERSMLLRKLDILAISPLPLVFDRDPYFEKTSLVFKNEHQIEILGDKKGIGLEIAGNWHRKALVLHLLMDFSAIPMLQESIVNYLCSSLPSIPNPSQLIIEWKSISGSKVAEFACGR